MSTFTEVSVQHVIVSFPLYIYESIFIHACNTTVSNVANVQAALFPNFQLAIMIDKPVQLLFRIAPS
jgi:hypothetical protein